jgi:hypothetical protein
MRLLAISPFCCDFVPFLKKGGAFAIMAGCVEPFDSQLGVLGSPTSFCRVYKKELRSDDSRDPSAEQSPKIPLAVSSEPEG